MSKISLIALIFAASFLLSSSQTVEASTFLSNAYASSVVDETISDSEIIVTNNNFDDSLDLEQTYVDSEIVVDEDTVEFIDNDDSVKEVKLNKDDVKKLKLHFAKTQTMQYFKFVKTSKKPSSVHVQGIADSSKSQNHAVTIYASSDCFNNCKVNEFPDYNKNCFSSFWADVDNMLDFRLVKDCTIYYGVYAKYNHEVDITIAHRFVKTYTDSEELKTIQLNFSGDEKYRYFTFEKTSKKPSSLHVQGIADSSKSENHAVTLYASLNCFDKCSKNIFPYSDKNCYSSFWKDVDNMLDFIFEEDCEIYYSVYLKYDKEVNITIAHRPMVTYNDSKEVQNVQLDFDGNENYRYFTFEKKSKDPSSLHIQGYADSSSKKDHAVTLYASSECFSNCKVTEFPNSNNNCFSSYWKDVNNMLDFKLEEDCVIHYGVALKFDHQVNLTIAHRPMVTYNDSKELQNHTLNFKGSENFRYFTFEKKSKDPSSLHIQGYADSSSKKDHAVTLYASSKCFSNCKVTEFPNSNNNCFSSFWRSSDNVLDFTLDEGCLIHFGVHLKYDQEAQIKITRD